MNELSGNKEKLINQLKTKKDLLRIIFEFNMAPAIYAHKSWIESIIPIDLLNKMQNSKRGLKILSELILHENHLSDISYDVFQESKYRLALLPRPVINELTLYGGIVLNHREIKTVIDRTNKKTIIDGIGEQGYRFAVCNAPLLIGTIDSKIDTQMQWKNLTGYLKKCGTILFLSAFSNDSEHLYKRLLFKFKRGIAQDNLFFPEHIESTKIISFYMRLLKQLVGKPWQELVL